MLRYILLVALLSLPLVESYGNYRDRIPNGESVPHPCKPNFLWKGVGHKNALGSGSRNPFGKAFAAAGRTWTRGLCMADSDGDGRTNGEELGDPNCEWSEGKAVKTYVGLTHPGVCDPWNAPDCIAKNTWVTCDKGTFECDAIKEPNTKNVTIRFPRTVVPNTETNYYCMMFELPSDDDYHLVATTPHIDNEDVMHHIVLYGCDESAGEVNLPLNKPFPCGMGVHSKCYNILSTWTVGSNGHCAHKNIGFRIGSKGYKKAAFQVHWNNPLLRNDYTDRSGLTLYYTRDKRVNNAAILSVGQEYLAIPPGQKKVEVDAWCHSTCTSRFFAGPLHVTDAFNHMHYMGREQYIAQYRNGTKITDITVDPVYSYDSPVSYQFQDPVELLPGDEIKTKCVFKSVGRSRTTFKGDATSDEMCYGFLTVYPAENMYSSSCVSWKSVPYCSFWMQDKVIDGCPILDFMNASNPELGSIFAEISSRCQGYGECLYECKEYVKNLKKTHPCMKNDIGDFVRYLFLLYSRDQTASFFAGLDSCDAEITREELQAVIDKNKANEKPCGCQGVGSASSFGASVLSVMAVIIMVVLI